MTFTVKVRGDTSRPIMAEYTCPEHGPFACFVQREANGDAPEHVCCPVDVTRCTCMHPDDRCGADCVDECGIVSTWTPSLVACKVKRFEVVRGGWQKPERKTYLDTRKLGEGQSVEEFQAERRKVWNEKRHRETKDLLR